MCFLIYILTTKSDGGGAGGDGTELVGSFTPVVAGVQSLLRVLDGQPAVGQRVSGVCG